MADDNIFIGQGFYAVAVENIYIARDSSISENVYILSAIYNYESIGLRILKQKLNVRHM